MFEYASFEQRTKDLQYRQLLKRLLMEGDRHPNQMEEDAFRLSGYELRFPLKNGFPMITERDLLSGERSTFRQAIAELIAFLHAAVTHEELSSFGCTWWKPWVSAEKCAKRGLPPGHLGPGSYGAAWRAFPTAEGVPFDQITHVVEQIRELPHLRTHFVISWIPQYAVRGEGKQQRVVVAPCHGIFHVHINTRTKTLSLVQAQRSGDVPVGVPGNLIQYAALTLMLAQVTGYVPLEYVHYISDAHFYERQTADVEDLISTEPQRLPTVTLDPTITNLFAFRPEHFTVTDYHPQLPRRRIPTPV